MNYVYEKNGEILFITNGTEGFTQDTGVVIHEVEEVPAPLQVFDFINGAFVLNQARSSAFEAWEAEHSAFVAQEEVNKVSRDYLAGTDWLVVREAETAVPVPSDVTAARASARAAVVALSEEYQNIVHD